VIRMIAEYFSVRVAAPRKLCCPQKLLYFFASNGQEGTRAGTVWYLDDIDEATFADDAKIMSSSDLWIYAKVKPPRGQAMRSHECMPAKKIPILEPIDSLLALPWYTAAVS